MNSTSTVPPIVPVSRWIWPGILIAGPASVVVACIITAFFVVQHPDGLVASDNDRRRTRDQDAGPNPATHGHDGRNDGG